MVSRSCGTARRNEHRDVTVQVRQAAVERHQLPSAAARELSKVSIGDLAAADHAAQFDVGE
ncbi:MAG: hypothetical protein QOD97_3427, partial [Mycobacterium sp.]|nr:hypothetical protein [Mycobacterium sp.]